MLSLFRRGSSGNQGQHQNSRVPSSSTILSSKRDAIVEKTAMEGADRELYRYDQPTQELGMSDLIKNHEAGTRFMYAAITGRESEQIGSVYRRLISFQPSLRKKSIPIDNLPVIKLFRETETFPLDQIIPKGTKGKSLGDYLRVSDAITLYGAVVSPDCNFTKVKVGISDQRLLTDHMVKSFTATTNLMTKGNLKLPYCVPTSDADQLVLTISRERSFLEEGRQWGAIQIQMTLEFSSFPMQFDNQQVAAVNMVPQTALETPLNDPDNIDLSIMNQDRAGLASLFLDGDLADENDPIENKTQAVKYSKSSLSGAKKGKKVQPAAKDWSFLSDNRVSIPAEQNSIDPDNDEDEEEDETAANTRANSGALEEYKLQQDRLRDEISQGKSSHKSMRWADETESNDQGRLSRSPEDEGTIIKVSKLSNLKLRSID